MPFSKIIFFLFLSFSLLNCGGSSGGSGDGSDGNESEDTVNTAKLVGTPFEGLETGDELGWSDFYEGEYRTETVDSTPIPIFLAFFTSSEEETIQEGVAIANEGAGFEAFEVIDEWQNNARVIYKVDYIWDPDNGLAEDYFSNTIGITQTLIAYFEDKTTAGTVVVDWVIELRSDGIDNYVVAHELGHAFGIISHAMIDYDNDRLSTEENNGLEENSLMEPDNGGSSPAINDYNYMMETQGELLLRHLGEEGDCCS